jgi:cyclopropane-fatty-acyl-phospholipid synthase
LTLTEGGQQRFFGDADAPLQARMEVLDDRIYRRLLWQGSIGAAEGFVRGEWRSPDLADLMQLAARNNARFDQLSDATRWLTRPLVRFQQWRMRNNRAGSRANIAAHYDLGNDMYEKFLDPLMQYSSGIYPDIRESSLEEAQVNKLHRICQRLELRPEDHLLEIGTGWGGLACFAAQHYGCRVTTTTLSEAQLEYTRARVRALGLEERVTLLLEDYRDVKGTYDKIVSVEMIEAVGYAYLPTYFDVLDRRLSPGGKMLVQAITVPDERYGTYLRDTDFIRQYVFPGGCLVSVGHMRQLLEERTELRDIEVESYGLHYARTLKDWRGRFVAAWMKIRMLGYDEDFRRLWLLYLAACEGYFAEREIDLVHLMACKPGGAI